jgi:hypothetical protein
MEVVFLIGAVVGGLIGLKVGEWWGFYRLSVFEMHERQRRVKRWRG